ncbi:MAG: acyl-CoA desaturase, partial [Bacteroidetes bacterium]|nr:acyl-CoA desaturase [Bacteroidota bacterium]
MSKITFNNKNNVFFQSLKSSVDQYFAEQKLKKTGNLGLYIKTAVLVPSGIAIYSVLLFTRIPAFTGILLAVVLGFILASIGFNVMHDA